MTIFLYIFFIVYFALLLFGCIVCIFHSLLISASLTDRSSCNLDHLYKQEYPAFPKLVSFVRYERIKTHIPNTNLDVILEFPFHLKDLVCNCLHSVDAIDLTFVLISCPNCHVKTIKHNQRSINYFLGFGFYHSLTYIRFRFLSSRGAWNDVSMSV